MWMKRILVCVAALLIICSFAYAQDLTAEEVEQRALMLKNEIVGDPNSKGSLNMFKPFQPIKMNSSSLKQKPSAFYVGIGIETDLID